MQRRWTKLKYVFLSLRWRYAPACGSAVVGLSSAYPALISRPALRNSITHWAIFSRAYGALCMGNPDDHGGLQANPIVSEGVGYWNLLAAKI
jgi:hypothetical protein